jgi:hypothetical protein
MITDVYFVSTTTHFVSTTSPHPCGTLSRLYDHPLYFVSTTTTTIPSLRPLPPFCLQRHHRTLAALYFVSTTSPHLCAPLRYSILSLRLPPLSHDIAAPLRHTISSLRPPPPTLSHRHRRVFSVITSSPPTTTHFVSTTSPRICGSPIVSAASPRLCGHFIWSLRLCTVPLRSFYSVSTTPPPITVLILSTFRASLVREGVSDYS